jgi:hypothetical protein
MDSIIAIRTDCKTKMRMGWVQIPKCGLMALKEKAFQKPAKRSTMVDYKLCPECKVPAYMTSEHSWLDNGDIVHSRDWTRRVAFIESDNIDPLLQGIERLILRAQLALRGLGNLRELQVSEKGLGMRLENTVLHLMTTGLMQGLFEIAYDLDSSVEWEHSAEGDLEVEITPRT